MRRGGAFRLERHWALYAYQNVEKSAAGLRRFSELLARTVAALPDHEAYLRARQMWSGAD